MDKNQTQRNKKISLKELWTLFLTAAIPVICVGGASYFPYMLRLPLMYAVGIGFILTFIFSGAKIRLNTVTTSFILFLSFIGITCLYSIDAKTSFNLFLIYLTCASLLFIDLPKSVVSKILSIMYIFCTVIAISIILSALVKNCMNTYFWFIVNPSRSPETTNAILRELSFGSYSGFAREMGEAAYIMDIGLGISFAKYFSTGKLTKSEILITLLFFAAVMLTGKRTMFLIPLFCICIFIAISNLKSKLFKVIVLLFIAFIAIGAIMMFVPQMSNVINKFLDNDNMENLGGRASLWPYIFAMISQYWFFGGGFGSYNEFAYQDGLRVNGGKWEYNAHNSYFQLLGETGIIGVLLFAAFAVSALVFTFRLIRKIKDDPDSLKLSYFSLYVQIMVLIYATTGNPLYTKQIIFTWLFSIGISLTISRTCNKENPRSLLRNG